MDLNKKVRDMVKEHGRVKTREKIESYLKHLTKHLEKSTSIDNGIDISNDIIDLQRMLEILDGAS
jgi:hypothetical protein